MIMGVNLLLLNSFYSEFYSGKDYYLYICNKSTL